MGLVDKLRPFVLPDLKESMALLRKGTPPRTYFFNCSGHLLLESFTGPVDRLGNKFPQFPELSARPVEGLLDRVGSVGVGPR